MEIEKYGKDYFEHGLEKGLSCYENYRWLPQLTISACKVIADFIGLKQGQRILDFGCSKGFYVKGFMEIGFDAWGWDISEYAIENAHPEIKDKLTLIKPSEFSKERWYDWVIAKDVLEHLEIQEFRNFLRDIPAPRGYFIIPLGLGARYNDPRNNMDKSHKICMPAWWWGLEILRENWTIIKYAEEVPGLKQAWATRDAYGHFICKRLEEVEK